MRPPWPCGTSARLLYQICLAEAWRQDVVVDASSGVVHACLEASQARTRKRVAWLESLS